jgi:tetratricopeptide (TPR) repeat protein
VPLDMWANGGILLFGTYLAFVAFTAWRFCVGLREHSGDRRFLLAGFGAAWFGYQVQSAVSIDKPALGVLHFVFAGAVHVLAGIPEWRERRLLGTQPQPQGRRSVQQTDLSGLQVLLASLVLVLGLAAAWLGSRPFRADLVYASGVHEISTNPQGAVDEIKRALELNPTEARYTFDLSRAYLVLGDKDAAIKAAGDGARLEPGDASYARYAGSVAANSGDVAGARKYYDLAVKIDPLGLDALLESAIFEATVGEADKARRLVDRALAITRDRIDVWRKAGTVYTLLHDDAGVAEAAKRLKELGL